MNDLRDVIPSMITPVRGGVVDVQSMHALGDLVEPPPHGLGSCSSTAAATSLSLDEYKWLVTSNLDSFAGRRPLIVGTSIDLAAPAAVR